MKTMTRARSSAFSAALVFMALGPAAAQSPEQKSPIVIDKRMPNATRTAATQALLQKTRARGRIRVIARLTLSLRSDDKLTRAQAAAQTRRLRAAQDGVVARSGAAASGVVRFDHIPFVSMFVNAEQLERLIADPAVVHIQEDIPLRPS